MTMAAASAAGCATPLAALRPNAVYFVPHPKRVWVKVLLLALDGRVARVEQRAVRVQRDERLRAAGLTASVGGAKVAADLPPKGSPHVSRFPGDPSAARRVGQRRGDSHRHRDRWWCLTIVSSGLTC